MIIRGVAATRARAAAATATQKAATRACNTKVNNHNSKHDIYLKTEKRYQYTLW